MDREDARAPGFGRGRGGTSQGDEEGEAGEVRGKSGVLKLCKPREESNSRRQWSGLESHPQVK